MTAGAQINTAVRNYFGRDSLIKCISGYLTEVRLLITCVGLFPIPVIPEISLAAIVPNAFNMQLEETAARFIGADYFCGFDSVLACCADMAVL